MRMQANLPAAKYCLFTEHENGIWEFRFTRANHQAVDEWVGWQDYLKNRPPKPGVTMVRTLLDFRPDGPVSLLYTLQKNVEWRRQNPDIDAVPVKVGVVLRPINRFQKGYADLVKEGINVFGMRSVRLELFHDNYPEAVEWLLEK